MLTFPQLSNNFIFILLIESGAIFYLITQWHSVYRNTGKMFDSFPSLISFQIYELVTQNPPKKTNALGNLRGITWLCPHMCVFQNHYRFKHNECASIHYSYCFIDSQIAPSLATESHFQLAPEYFSHNPKVIDSIPAPLV